MSNHWSTRYIGLPYSIGGRDRDGVDCWGLLCLVYQNEQGIRLPELPGVVQWDSLAISREILGQSKGSWSEVSAPMEGCAVAMSLREVLHHVGIWTDADGGKVIHAWKDHPVVADTIKSLRLKGIRTIKFFVYGSDR